MPYLDRDGVKIHYEVTGDGPVVLCTHGYSLTGHLWQGAVTALQDRYRVVTWDIRGHGHSDSPTDPAAYSKDLALADMNALIDAAGASEAILMGHSLGGYLSLAFHVEHAARVRALVLVGTGPGYRNPEARAGWNQQAEERARHFETHGIDNMERPESHGNRHRSAQGLALAARGILAQHDGLVMEDLPGISVPTLIVVGADDTPFLGASDYMEKRIPGARKVVLPAAGHMPNLDQPALFAQALRGFLDGMSV
jgi:pimeloyl-ACP methyl ester carboxylesterase